MQRENLIHLFLTLLLAGTLCSLPVPDIAASGPQGERTPIRVKIPDRVDKTSGQPDVVSFPRLNPIATAPAVSEFQMMASNLPGRRTTGIKSLGAAETKVAKAQGPDPALKPGEVSQNLEKSNDRHLLLSLSDDRQFSFNELRQQVRATNGAERMSVENRLGLSQPENTVVTVAQSGDYPVRMSAVLKGISNSMR